MVALSCRLRLIEPKLSSTLSCTSSPVIPNESVETSRAPQQLRSRIWTSVCAPALLFTSAGIRQEIRSLPRTSTSGRLQSTATRAHLQHALMYLDLDQFK